MFIAKACLFMINDSTVLLYLNYCNKSRGNGKYIQISLFKFVYPLKESSKNHY